MTLNNNQYNRIIYTMQKTTGKKKIFNNILLKLVQTI